MCLCRGNIYTGWTYSYMKKNRCGSYTHKCTFPGPKHCVTKLITDFIAHFSQQHHSLSQLSFYYIWPWESLNLGEGSFFAAFGQQSPFSHCFHELLGNNQKYSSDCSFVGHAYVSQQCERMPLQWQNAYFNQRLRNYYPIALIFQLTKFYVSP